MTAARRRNERNADKRSSTALWHGILILSCNPSKSYFSSSLFSLESPSVPICDTISCSIIATIIFGFLFYSLTVMAALVSPACPLQTPISMILCILRINGKIIFSFYPFLVWVQIEEVLRPTVILASRYLHQLITRRLLERSEGVAVAVKQLRCSHWHAWEVQFIMKHVFGPLLSQVLAYQRIGGRDSRRYRWELANVDDPLSLTQWGTLALQQIRLDGRLSGMRCKSSQHERTFYYYQELHVLTKHSHWQSCGWPSEPSVYRLPPPER